MAGEGAVVGRPGGVTRRSNPIIEDKSLDARLKAGHDTGIGRGPRQRAAFVKGGYVYIMSNKRNGRDGGAKMPRYPARQKY
jgi:hypothetical protein